MLMHLMCTFLTRILEGKTSLLCNNIEHKASFLAIWAALGMIEPMIAAELRYLKQLGQN